MQRVLSLLSRLASAFRLGASPAPSPLRLRAAWLEGGQICAERVIAPGEALTVGAGGALSAGIGPVVVAGWSRGGWWLDPGAAARAGGEVRLSRGEAAVAVGAGGAAEVRLERGHRLKIRFPQGTLLCQVIEVAVMQRAGAQRGADVGRDGEDRLFEGLLTGSAVTFAAFALWVQSTEAVAAEPSVEDLMRAIDLSRVVRLPTPELIKELSEPEPGKAAEKAARAAQRAGGESKQPSSPIDKEAQGQAAANRVIKGLLEGKRLDDLMRGPTGSIIDWEAAALGEGKAPIDGIEKPGSLEDREIVDAPVGLKPGEGLKPGTGGPGGTGGDGKIEIKPVVRVAEPDIDPEVGDIAAVEGVIRKFRGGVETCVSEALALDPRVSGRLTVGWQIEAGIVRGVRLVENGTGNEKLGGCVQGVVRRMRFDPGVTGEVPGYTWVVSGK